MKQKLLTLSAFYFISTEHTYSETQKTSVPTWQHTKKMKSVIAVHSTFSLNWIYRTDWRDECVHCMQNSHCTLTLVLNAVSLRTKRRDIETEASFLIRIYF